MKNYRLLYCLRLEHEYYKDGKCRCIDVRTSPSDTKALRRRGLMLKQTEENEWCILSSNTEGSYIGSDTFLLDFYLLDSTFAYYTDWTQFVHTDLYELKLPNAKAEFAAAIEKKTLAPRIGSKFCIATLNLDEKTFSGSLVTNTFKFFSRKVHWEYVFIPRDRTSKCGMPYNGQTLKLKEKEDRISFDQPEMKELFGGIVWIVKSKDLIPIAISYDYELSLYANDDCTLMDRVPYPVPGLFQREKTESGGDSGAESEQEVIRQICYFGL